jgi:hypothetical protein
MPPTIDVLDAEEAAELIGYTPRGVRKLCATGRLRARKVAGVWVIPRSAVEQHNNEKSPDQDDPAGANVC